MPLNTGIRRNEVLISMQYPDQTIKRARRAICCAPFHRKLFEVMGRQSVSPSSIAGASGVEQGYTRQSLAELAAENAFLWLIQVGVLRREVDGQGLTDHFRLTPLGHQLVKQWQTQNWHPSLQDRVQNALSRWLRLPV